MEEDPATQTRKQSRSGKEDAAETQKTMQPERKISRANMTADTQQGQSEADRLEVTDQSKR